MTEREQSQLDRIERRIVNIENTISGGTEPQKGFIVRIDRLERTISGATRVAWIALGAAVVSIVRAAWVILSGTGGGPNP
jgi:hypothetical protein